MVISLSLYLTLDAVVLCLNIDKFLPATLTHSYPPWPDLHASVTPLQSILPYGVLLRTLYYLNNTYSSLLYRILLQSMYSLSLSLLSPPDMYM